jgi:hypothetical protein
VLLGAFVLVIVSWVPCIGWLIGFATTCVSLGLAVLSRMGTHVYGTVPVATPPAPPAPPAPPEPPAA